ncbi:MAG: hypothetical protein C0404_03115 [Verrucomicrobia bacterium]|nr:hypothetical protein [Verrucomicrobiota bacterium]
MMLPGKEPEHATPRFCAPPDGKCLYFVGVSIRDGGVAPCVYRMDLEGKLEAKPWVGNPNEPGTADNRLNRPLGIACDGQGRVYVADNSNGRLQVFSPDSKLYKSIPIDRPMYVCVHHKTGAIYIQHDTRVEGKTVRRTSKLASVDKPDVVGYVDGPFGAMALDMWSDKPRLWFSNTTPADMGLLGDGSAELGNNVTAWEDDGKSFKKIVDFDEIARKEDGKFHSGRWGGSGLGQKVACDPTRETVMVDNRRLFDLKTGLFVTDVKIPAYSYDDVAFDKRGYMHVHLNPGFDGNPGVLRVDPGRAKPTDKSLQYWPETPYDYGIELPGAYSEPRKGVLPCRDQPGAKYFQDGVGVNMRGEVATDSNIYYVPKFDDLAKDFIADLRGALPPGAGGRFPSYTAYSRQMEDKLKKGEEVYSIHKEPGVLLAGATIWTFKRNGEVQDACAVTAGGLINGAMIDEDGGLYFVLGLNGRTRMKNGRAFLEGAAGHFGSPAKLNPFTGTMVKSKPSGVKVLWSESPIKLEPLPQRPADIGGFGSTDTQGTRAWVEGAEWLYAGASPTISGGCSCPTQRLHVDWFKRVYVPEQYRHSIGILDTRGNLLLHVGQYGNFDSGEGAKSRIPVGGDGIAMSAVRFVSSTDNYMVFDDGGERLTVLKLNYHAEASAPVK